MKQLLTLAESAELLRVSEHTAERLAVKGLFPGDAAVRVGRQWRVSRPRLEAWLHGATHGYRVQTLRTVADQ